jgi:predicted lipid-binding transport protein (Tim44 family)
MAGDTPKEDNTTEPTPNGQEPQGVARPPDILFAAAGGGLVGGLIGAIVGSYLSGG